MCFHGLEEYFTVHSLNTGDRWKEQRGGNVLLLLHEANVTGCNLSIRRGRPGSTENAALHVEPRTHRSE